MAEANPHLMMRKSWTAMSCWKKMKKIWKTMNSQMIPKIQRTTWKIKNAPGPPLEDEFDDDERLLLDDDPEELWLLLEDEESKGGISA